MTKFEEEVKRPDNTGIDPFSKGDVDFSKIAEKFTRGAQTLKSWRNYADYKEHQLEQKDEQIQSLAKMVDKLNGQNVDLKGELEEVRDLQCEANNQAAKEYIDRCEAESKLKELKSQLQQQALPVVPNFIGEWLDSNNLAGLLDEWYCHHEDMSPHIREYFERLPYKGPNNLSEMENNIVTFITRAKLGGYIVEKPQLFYLKHIEMSKSDAHLNWYLAKGSDNILLHQGIKKNKIPKLKCILKLTQQEIDSMKTESYEKIEVAE